MATSVGDLPFDSPSSGPNAPVTGSPLVRFIDKWLFVGMAGFFFLSMLAGFIPSSIEKLGQMNAGLRPPFQAIHHVHAVLMGSWMTLLLVQPVLVATGRTSTHRKLGLVAFALVPAIILVASALAYFTAQFVWADYLATPEGAAKTGKWEMVHFLTNLLLTQFKAIIAFLILAVAGLFYTRKDTATHKRLMLLATLVPMGAGIDRLALPGTVPGDYIMLDVYSLIWISPLFFWDLFRLGKIQKAYWIWIGVMAPLTILLHILYDNARWFDGAQRLLGVAA